MNVAGRQHHISDSQYQLLAEFRRQIRSFLHFSEEAARAAGIETQQHQLLLALRGLPEGTRPTIKVLSEYLSLRHHTTVELVDRLVKRRAIAREQSGEDRREVNLRITPEGEQVLRGLSTSHWNELMKAGPALAESLDSLLAHSVR
jgi:DNA-binding MarR family transcriptional regulator